MAGRARRGGFGEEVREGPAGIQELVRDLQGLATLGSPRFDFLREVASRIRDLASCQLVVLAVRGGRRWYAGRLGESWTLKTVPLQAGEDSGPLRAICEAGILSPSEVRCCRLTLGGVRDRFWKGKEPAGCEGPGGLRGEAAAIVGGEGPFGILLLVWPASDMPSRGRGLALTVARPLATALLYHKAQAALRERVKELTGLYELSKLTERKDAEPEDVLARIASLLPPAWQYPEITVGRVELDGRVWRAGGEGEPVAWQREPVLVQGVARGELAVGYTEERPELDEGPFMREERSLIVALARETGLYIERWEANRDRRLLEEQLRHADRLATIGQLAAGVAHELNEPLAAILGFAQLALDAEGVPETVREDLNRITKASLHAREVIKKLMLFARQTPPRREDVEINRLVEESLYFLESRCAKQGIEVRRELGEGLPPLQVDPGQLQQVLVNLVVNAVHAMPDGGRLVLRTRRAGRGVCLEVEDTGCGIPEEIRDRIFLPFFTTKDVDHGTGLGLAVVHGIVSAHGGTIEVDSEPGKGSRFRVVLPTGRVGD